MVPFQHLIPQWEEVLNNFGYKKIIKAFGNFKLYKDDLVSTIDDYNYGLRNKVAIITTYNTASKKNFIKNIKNVKENLFGIFDECHYSGTKIYRNVLLNNYTGKLGLSATPLRWFDKEGTYIIKNYFKKIIFKFSLDEAIKKDYLTKYEYNPVLVNLTENEEIKYIQLSNAIRNLYLHIKIEENIKLEEELKLLLIKRSDLLAKAKNKIDILINLLKKEKDLSHTIVYCSKNQTKEIVRKISQLGIKTHEFIYTVSKNDREKILNLFAKGKIQILVAIKCLDEGVDIPSTKRAYILASTSNPKEFIQRRGRILRKSNNKIFSTIYDFITLPNPDFMKIEYSKYNKKILCKEMPRFLEFSNLSINKFEARSIMKGTLKKLNLSYLLYENPENMHLKEENNEKS
ncbi:helicase-related protein [Oceanotoga sp. DSM 15011]|uniref:helicase-related protein n=1 Tax=Oceanotoga sp. DSM 15011 TaxID=2984951 RepID=UPI0021F4EDC7|nr:helicase-related protein [Oceanotoga sp. DSM 15011]UYP01280.1 helicase-related protein [Oceanotoga sp. DSM 15011]